MIKNQIPIDTVRYSPRLFLNVWDLLKKYIIPFCRNGFPPTSAIYLSSHLFINLFFYLDLWCVNTVFIKLAEPGHLHHVTDGRGGGGHNGSRRKLSNPTCPIHSGTILKLYQIKEFLNVLNWENESHGTEFSARK